MKFNRLCTVLITEAVKPFPIKITGPKMSWTKANGLLRKYFDLRMYSDPATRGVYFSQKKRLGGVTKVTLDQIFKFLQNRVNSKVFYNGGQIRVPFKDDYIQDKTPKTLFIKAREAKKRSSPKEEAIIMKSPVHAYKYALKVLKQRWPEAEPYIIRNMNTMAKYWKEVVQGPWPEGEKLFIDAVQKEKRLQNAIVNDRYSFYQLLEVRGGERWPEVEQYISPEGIISYVSRLNKRYPDLEKRFIRAITHGWKEDGEYIDVSPDEYAEQIVQYAINAIKGRWPKMEKYIKDPDNIIDYAEGAIKGRWIEKEPFIEKHKSWREEGYYWKQYIDRIIKVFGMGNDEIGIHNTDADIIADLI